MKISVYITSYNQKKYLVEAIESVLAQTLPPIQIIIVDDCSQDGSQRLIADYASRFPDLFVPIYHTVNKGVAHTRIEALQVVTGDYVTYVDGDDRYLPTKLEKEATLLQENPDVQIAFSNNYYMTEDGNRTRVWADGEIPPQGYVFCQVFARDYPRRSLFRMELVDYRAWKRIGFHDPKLRFYEDDDMRIRLTKHCQTIYYDEPLTEIRQTNIGLSSVDPWHHLVALEYIYRKNRPLLNDLGSAERKEVQRKVQLWMAGKARRLAERLLEDGQYQHGRRLEALKCYLCCLRYQPSWFDHRLAVRILFPPRS